MSTIRLFYALDLSDETLDALQELQQACESQIPSGVRVRWTPRENLHLTLKFLGSMEEDLVEDLGELMDGLVGDLGPFRMRTEGIGAFPHPKRPRILWAGVDPESAAQLATLHRRLEDELDSFDVEEDNHPFKAHITFGRIKSGKSVNLNSLRSSLPEGPFGESEIGEVVLYKSELRPEGSNYRVVYQSHLGRGDSSD